MTQVTIIRQSDGKELLKFFPPDRVPMVPLLRFTLNERGTKDVLNMGEPVILKVDNNIAPTMSNKEIFHATGYLNDIIPIQSTNLINVFYFLQEIIHHVPINDYLTAYDRAMAIVKQ